MAERRLQLDQFRERLDDARKNEQLNQFGVMPDSELTVHVIQAEDIRTAETYNGSQIEP